MGSFGPSTPTYSKSMAVLGSQGESIVYSSLGKYMGSLWQSSTAYLSMGSLGQSVVVYGSLWGI